MCWEWIATSALAVLMIAILLVAIAR